MATEPNTRDRLLEAGLRMLLEHGYNHLGVQVLLDATGVPKGSFYHHFESKEDFALQVIDAYMVKVHEALDGCLDDASRPPLQRIRLFFETVEKRYRAEGYLGCLLGGLGQELAGVSEAFAEKIERCFSQIAAAFQRCLRQAKAQGDLPASTDVAELADLIVNSWEGAALRTRLRRDPGPLRAMLDFHFGRPPRRRLDRSV